MKNKEIEELLKGMKDVSNTEGCSMNLDRYLVKLLLSYIEQRWKRYLENQKYEKYDKEDLVDEIMELQQEKQQLKEKLNCKEYFSSTMPEDTDFKEDLLRMLGEIDE